MTTLSASFLGALLVGPFSFGISRVGNGKVTSLAMGYSLSVPDSYQKMEQIGPESMRFIGMSLPMASGISSSPLNLFQPSLIELYPLEEKLREYADLNREQFSEVLHGKGYNPIAAPIVCIIAGINHSETASYALVMWGQRKGYILVGAKNAQVESAIKAMVQSMELQEGLCQWK